MTIDMMEIVGIVAAFCTTASFVPQVVHTWKSKSVKDISLRMYLLFTFGVSMWLWYGIHLESFSIVAANGVTLVLALSILAMKIVFGRRPPE